MQTVLHCKNSNKEGHIHRLLTERESQGDWWKVTQDLADWKCPPNRSFCRCCQGGHTLCKLLPCFLPYLACSGNLCSPWKHWLLCGCRDRGELQSLTHKITGGDKLSHGVCWSMSLMELDGGNLYCWSLSIKHLDRYQHRGSIVNEVAKCGSTWDGRWVSPEVVFLVD